ncbi:phosphate ABC transporter permease PstA [Candidatus Kaiserbacteria bacterium]|nr:phosphate ABC transporter permease PstA [Candidatus Kaiserbacteria bacterium]
MNTIRTHARHRGHLSNALGIGLLWTIASIVALLFLGIIAYIMWEGVQYLFDPVFYGTREYGIGRELFNTLYLLILSQVLLLPIALGAAIYLTEYARTRALVDAIHFAAETLASVPSLVLGLFGVLIFVSYFGLGTSRIAGALALVCLNLPFALRLFENAITAVPHELREGAYALGATTWHTIWTIVLPSALPDIVTTTILTSNRVIGESAVLLFTMGLFSPANSLTLDWSLPGATLTTHLYNVTGPGAGTTGLSMHQEMIVTAGSAALLITVILLFNIFARVIGHAVSKSLAAE